MSVHLAILFLMPFVLYVNVASNCYRIQVILKNKNISTIYPMYL